MTAVWYRFRAELPTRWRAWFGLTLLVAIDAVARLPEPAQVPRLE